MRSAGIEIWLGVLTALFIAAGFPAWVYRLAFAYALYAFVLWLYCNRN